MKLFWIFALCSLSALAQPPASFIIRSVNVVDVNSGKIVPRQDVAVLDGKISEIRAAADSDAADRRVVQGAGMYLIPGLWDMHVHFRSNPTDPDKRLINENAAMLELFLANGIVGVREMGGDLADQIIRWRNEIRAGTRIGPRILTAGRKLDEIKPAWPGSIAVTTPEEAREAVRQIKASGADFIKIYFGQVSPEILKVIAEEAHAAGLKVTGHLPRNMTLQEAVRTGIDGIEHERWAVLTEEQHRELERERTSRSKAGLPISIAEGIAREMWMHDPAEATRLNETLAAKHFWITPTLLVQNRVRVDIAERDFDSDPRKRYFAPAIWSSWDIKGGLRKPPPAETVAAYKRALKMVSERTLEMERAGVPLLAGSDCGVANNYILPGWALHEELQALVAAGLSPAEALRMATINPAQWRGEAETQGSIEKGKQADLLLLRANPLTTIAATREIEAVFVKGKEYSREALDGMLARAEGRWAVEWAGARK
jgi:imidazolonepropionase-like amidohydrolase